MRPTTYAILNRAHPPRAVATPRLATTTSASAGPAVPRSSWPSLGPRSAAAAPTVSWSSPGPRSAVATYAWAGSAVAKRLAALAVSVLAVLVATAPAPAQIGGPAPVDRVVAVVGDSAVLLSQLLERENELRSLGEPVPPAGTPEHDQFMNQQLDELVNHQIVLQAAVADTLLAVDETAVESAVQEHLDRVQSNYPSRRDMEQALGREGLTMQGYRERLRQQVRQQKLVELYLRMHTGSAAVEVSEGEMRELFEAGQETLEQRPATISFLQVLLSVTPGDSAKAAAREIAEALAERARQGEEFADLAREHSQDPGSAEAGGDLGWFRRDGGFVDEFEDAAFSLMEGQVSDVVETIFGYHVIRVDQVRVSERRARHILVIPETTLDDVVRARSLAEDLARQAREGRDFRDIVDAHHDALVFPFPADSATVPVAQIAQMLPPAYLAPLGGQRSPGDLLGPIQFAYQGKERFAVLKILETREAGAFEFEDLRDRIRASLVQQKRFSALLEGLRANTYVEIKTY